MGGAECRERRAEDPAPARGPDRPRTLVGADDLEARVDEDVVRPVDADVVNLVPAAAALDNAVDDATRVGGQRRCGRLVRGRSADDRARALAVIRRDPAVLLWRG